MGSEGINAVGSRKQVFTPKALIHQKYGSKACYKIEEVQDVVNNACPGLAIPQQTRSLYRCSLNLPELSVTSDTFTRKKDAEQSAAQIAVEKLGIQSTSSIPSPEEAWSELTARISCFFTDEFLSSSHPLVGHLRVALERKGDLFGMIPLSAVAACDVKVNGLCKIIDPGAEFDPNLLVSFISKAAKMSSSVHILDKKLWMRRQGPYSPEAIDSLLQRWPAPCESTTTEAVFIPSAMEEQPTALRLYLSANEHYMDDIARKLSVGDSSELLVSRTVGKASSETKLYFPNLDLQAGSRAGVSTGSLLNKRACYISGQAIYGDAILANIGYTWKSLELHIEDVSLCAYYRMLLGKLPDGNYKLSREAILAAELPSVYNRTNWKGLSPRDLLCAFCRQQRLSEPVFSISRVDSPETTSSESVVNMQKLAMEKQSTANNDQCVIEINKDRLVICEVKILSRRQEVLLEYSGTDAHIKDFDAIHNSALKVLTWFNNYFKQMDKPVEKLASSESTSGIKVYPLNFSQEFAACLSVYRSNENNNLAMLSSLESCSKDESKKQLENNMVLSDVEGPDSGVFPSFGSLTCISYDASLVKNGSDKTCLLESNDQFEFEIGTGAVISQLESCVTQLSVNQAAKFIVELPPRDLILAAASGSMSHLSELALYNFLEFSVKVMRVTEPLEDRMEKALFSPPLSKQRVEFAVRHINQLNATTLVDFGCGSGSLLDSLMEHSTPLEKLVGVDISRKALTRAAKSLHQKLSKNPTRQPEIISAALYYGSITDFDSRLNYFDIGTCLEVIEHMEEEQACLFGDVVLSSFCPKVLIVSTPNYEYNPILQKSALPNYKEDEREEKAGPCKFRNHDHKFEWTRTQFEHWATKLAATHDYSVEFSGVGGLGDVEPGFASQIAIFKRNPSPPQEKMCLQGDSGHPYELIWESAATSRSSH